MLALVLCTVSLVAQAQNRLSGTVVDENQNPLPGVNIRIQGTGSGATTDLDGKYTITNLAQGNVLVFSFIGYLSQEIAYTGQSTIDVTLQPNVAELSEVVVIGYGTQEKKDVTGAMSTLTPKDFNQGVVTNPMELMQGRASGVQITPSSGEPGAAISVNIRGIGSIRSGNNPLFVIDGIPLSGGNASPGASDIGDVGGSQAKNPLNFLNPEDIESIDILKDASATAIYGSRGANGVVLITTKKGEEGEARLQYSTYLGMSQLRRKLDVLSAADYRRARILLAAETGNTGYLDFDFGANTDWQDAIFRTSLSHNHAVSISGGSAKSNYFASIGYMDQQGIVENTALQRINGRINLSQSLIDDRLNVGLNLTASNIRDKAAPIGDGGGFLGDALANALKANPTMPITNEDGSYFQFSAADRNPVAMINLIDDRTTTDRILGNVTADLRLWKELRYHVNLGLSKSIATRHTNFSNELLYITPQGWAGIQYNEFLNKTFEQYFSYQAEIGGGTLNALAGYSYQRFETNWHSMVGQGYISNEILPTGNIGGHTGEIQPQIYSGGPVSELQSVFGRLNYSYQDKYLATVSLRADGSSRFGPNNRYGYFPSAALGWRLSEEAFLQNSAAISNLKLRLGWGQTGNQEFADYIPYRVMTKNPTTGGLQVVQQAQPNIRWETTSQFNLGLDFGLWDDKVTGTLDYFYKNTTDLLVEVPLPAPSITERGWQNIDANLINKGVELTVTSNWLTTTEFDWSTTVNVTQISNRIENFNSVFGTGVLNGQGLTGITVQRIESGYPLQSFYLREFTGYDDAGISQYANDGELRHVASPYPKVALSLSNSVTYKDFDFSFFLDSKVGQYVYNNTANTYFNKSSLGQAKNITYAELYSPRSIEDAVLPSTRYLENASFMRLAQATLGYNLTPERLPWISRARVYVTGQNLLVLTGYSGYDPEVNTNKSVDGVPSFGIDYTSYPRPRTVIAGLNVTF